MSLPIWHVYLRIPSFIAYRFLFLASLVASAWRMHHCHGLPQYQDFALTWFFVISFPIVIAELVYFLDWSALFCTCSRDCFFSRLHCQNSEGLNATALVLTVCISLENLQGHKD